MFNNYRVPNWHFHHVREIMKLPFINLENFILQKRFQVEDENKAAESSEVEETKNDETTEKFSNASPEDQLSSSESSSDEEDSEELEESDELEEPVFIPPADLPGEKSIWTKTGDLIFIFKESSKGTLNFQWIVYFGMFSLKQSWNI